MVGWGVDISFEKVAGDHVTVVDENGPDLDEEEEEEEEVFVHGDEEGEDAAGNLAKDPCERSGTH